MKALYRRQAEISAKKLANYVGKTLDIVCDGIDYEKSCFVGRAYFQAYEIDGNTYFTSPEAEEGKTYRVHIDRAQTYDLFGHTVEE